jgi:hypothetical protein
MDETLLVEKCDGSEKDVDQRKNRKKIVVFS